MLKDEFLDQFIKPGPMPLSIAVKVLEDLGYESNLSTALKFINTQDDDFPTVDGDAMEQYIERNGGSLRNLSLEVRKRVDNLLEVHTFYAPSGLPLMRRYSSNHFEEVEEEGREEQEEEEDNFDPFFVEEEDPR